MAAAVCDCYRQHCAQRKSAGISFTQRPILTFFAPQGRHVAPMGVKFGMEEGTYLLHAKFHPHRCNVSPLRGEKPQNRPLSKLNTGRFALRAMLPVTSFWTHCRLTRCDFFLARFGPKPPGPIPTSMAELTSSDLKYSTILKLRSSIRYIV